LYCFIKGVSLSAFWLAMGVKSIDFLIFVP
jgi:hypothetical protein